MVLRGGHMENNLSKQILKVLETSSRLTDREIAVMLGVPEEKQGGDGYEKLDERMVVTP